MSGEATKRLAEAVGKRQGIDLTAAEAEELVMTIHQLSQKVQQVMDDWDRAAAAIHNARQVVETVDGEPQLRPAPGMPKPPNDEPTKH